jgi:excisionase family DNA binding protein
MNFYDGKEPQYLDLSGAIAYLKCSKSMLYKLTSGKRIPHFNPTGKKLYFIKQELDNWIRSARVKTVKESVVLFEQSLGKKGGCND